MHLLTGTWGFSPFFPVSRTFGSMFLACPNFPPCFLPLPFSRTFVFVFFSPYFFLWFPALFSYYNSSTVVQVPWLPEVTKGHVTPKGWKCVSIGNRKLGFPALFSGCFRLCCVVLQGCPRSHYGVTK